MGAKMKFEVINDKNKTIYYTYDRRDVPSSEYLNSMSNAGYRFKIDGRIASKKKVEELKQLIKETK